MKGILFNVAEEVVTELLGPDGWDDLLDAAGVEGAYTSLGQYDDAELVAIVAAASEILDMAPEDVLRTLGQRGFAGLAGRYPQLLAGHGDMRSILATLNSVIHPQVLALYPGASVPSFEYLPATGDPSTIDLVYRSDRGLCHLAEGLTLGLADHFGEHVTVSQATCRHLGDPECRLVVVSEPHG